MVELLFPLGLLRVASKAINREEKAHEVLPEQVFGTTGTQVSGWNAWALC